MLCLADIQLDILCLSVLSDDHPGVNLLPGTDEESTPFLSTVQTVSHGFACLKCDQGTLFPVLDISLVRCISVKTCVQDAVSFGICQKFAPVSDQSSGRNGELKTGISAVRSTHVLEFAFSLPEFFNDNSCEFVRHVNVGGLHGLQLFAVFISFVEDFRLADGKLVSFAPHVLDQNGEVKFASSGYLEAVCIVGLLHTQADVCVQLPEQSFAEMTGSYIFSFLSGKRTVIDNELHGDRRLGDLLKRDRLRIFRGTEGVSDGDVRDTGDRDDGSDGRLFYLYSVKPVELIEFTDLDLFLLVRIMVIDKDHFLIYRNGPVVHFSDPDTSYILVVIDGADENLSRSFRIAFRSRDVFQDCFKQRFHILFVIRQIEHGYPCFG